MKNRLPYLLKGGDWRLTGGSLAPIIRSKGKTLTMSCNDESPQTLADIAHLTQAYRQIEYLEGHASNYTGRATRAASPEVQAAYEWAHTYHSLPDHLKTPSDPAKPPQLPPLDKLPAALRPLMYRAHILAGYDWLTHLPDQDEYTLRSMAEAANLPAALGTEAAFCFNNRARWNARTPDVRTRICIDRLTRLEALTVYPTPSDPGEGMAKSDKCGPDGEANGSHIWGNMEMKTINLPNRIKCPRAVRRAFVGSPVYIHRYVTDAKMFRLKKRSAEGTILCDVSGSMCITPAQVAECIRRKPLATVAVYSGDDGKYGHLTIIAKGGRMFEASQHEWPGGNTVDGLALDWLGTQSEPRIWISDGGVTHPYGSTEDAISYCDRRMEASRITRYKSLSRYLAGVDPETTTR